MPKSNSNVLFYTPPLLFFKIVRTRDFNIQMNSKAVIFLLRSFYAQTGKNEKSEISIIYY